MAEEIVMPRLGWTMEEGTLVEWLKEDGAAVETGELLFTVEGDKALNEIETFVGGILHLPSAAPQPGDTVPVGTVLGYLLEVGEQPPAYEATKTNAAADTQTPAQAASTMSDTEPSHAVSATEPTISPRARRVAAELGVDWQQLQGSGRSGRIVERDVRAAQGLSSAAPKATPIAQRLAAEAGLDLAELAAQKQGGRIEREDVEAAVEAARAMPTTSTSQPITRVRQLIAAHLSTSAHTTAAVTLTTEADATELVVLRQKFKDSLGQNAPTYNDLLIKLSASALGKHPALNASWHNEEIQLHATVHMGVATDTDDGLLVPVIRDAQSKNLQQIAAETKTLFDQARQRQLKPEDMQDGTFTLTNLGMYGIDAFTPIINLPQCAILGIGRIIEKPAVHDGQIVVRSMMALSLTFDHRVLDGGPAARFLDQVRSFVEQPYQWLSE